VKKRTFYESPPTNPPAAGLVPFGALTTGAHSRFNGTAPVIRSRLRQRTTGPMRAFRVNALPTLWHAPQEKRLRNRSSEASWLVSALG